jgi:hypothetical protein
MKWDSFGHMKLEHGTAKVLFLSHWIEWHGACSLEIGRWISHWILIDIAGDPLYLEDLASISQDFMDK